MWNELMANWLGSFGRILLAVLILLVMITVHEFGHYLVGKLLKFRINEFSIGFGPAIFKHKNKKTGELFALRLIPLGGYCAFDGEDGLDEETKDGASMSEEGPSESAEIFPDAELQNAPSEHVELTPAVQIGPAEGEIAPQNGEALPAENRVSEGETSGMPPAEAARGGKFTEMAPWKRILVLVAGAFMNYLLALVFILILFGAYGQSLIMVRGADVTEEYPAAGSFREGDILLAAEGRNLYLTTDIALALNGKKQGETAVFRVSEQTETGRREAVREIVLRCDVELESSTQVSAAWKALGIGVEELEDGKYYMLSTVSYRFGFFETVGRSFVYSFKIAGSIFRVIGELFTGRLGLNALGGPVTTIVTTSKIASTNIQSFLEITAYIGVNLALFNLLPIPALDGSKVVFTAIEWVRGKPISRKVEAVIHAVGFVLLLGFAILVDILQYV